MTQVFTRARALLAIQSAGPFALILLSACPGPAPDAGSQGGGGIKVYGPTADAGDADSQLQSYPPDDAGEPPSPSDASAVRVTSIGVSPLTLIPTFSPDVQDYYVRCATGQNVLTVTVVDSNGSSTSTAVLVPDQALIVENQYWIRCLPPDFPTITASPSGTGPTPGFYLLNTSNYAMVLDTRATPVWYARGTNVVDVESQLLNTISLCPNDTQPYGLSTSVVFQVHDLESQTTTNVQAVGSPTDGHELRFLTNGDYLLLTYPTVSNVDLTGLGYLTGGASIADCEIQEVDPEGNLVWSWLASDHIDPAAESLEPSVNEIGGDDVVDVFHCNSIDVDPKGNLLLSVRYANAVYYIDRGTGQILWKLGGTPTNKDDAQCIEVMGDPEGSFNMQHDARLLANGDVTMFDDHGATAGVARGVEYALDMEAGTASVVSEYLGTVASLYEGSFRRYDDGESVIGWGAYYPELGVLTEFDEDGNDVFDVFFSPEAVTYRAIKLPLAMLDIALLRETTAKW